MNVVNEEICRRLRSERERLGISQTAMAGMTGVSRATQVNYESGKRLPDTPYLLAAGRLGVDVPFLLTGLHTTADSIEVRAITSTLRAICNRLGINCVLPLESAYEDVELSLGKPKEFADDIPSLLEEVEKAVFDAVTNIELDGTLLAGVIAYIEEIEEIIEVDLRPVTKADVAVMLYRTFKLAGKSDFVVAEQAVKLAAGIAFDQSPG